MDKKDLKDKLNSIKESIKKNSKDVHFAESLISDLLSVKGQIEHQPTIVSENLEDVVDSLEGNTFVMYKMKDGSVIYHIKGGYTIVCEQRFKCLNETITQIIEERHEIDSLSEKEREDYYLSLSAHGYCLSLPLFYSNSPELQFEAAGLIIRHLRDAYEKDVINAELREESAEDKEKNDKFEDANNAIRDLDSAIKEIKKD